MSKKNDQLYFLINVENGVFFNNEQEKIIDFEIKRLNHFFNCSIWLLDLNNNLKQKSKFSKIVLNNIENNFLNLNPNTLFFIIELTNPIMDIELIHKMSILLRKNDKIIPIGAIPGTAPEIGLKKDGVMEYLKNKNETQIKSKKMYVDSQRIFNNQFNLKRPVRRKLFLGLLKKNNLFYKFSIKKFIRMLETKEYFNYLLDYCEKINAKEFKKCPNCKSYNKKPLYFSSSQPVIGFIPPTLPLYFKCIDCNLVFLRKQCMVDDLENFYDEYERPTINQDQIISDFIIEKKGTHYNEKIMISQILNKHLKKNSKIVDIGCGFGELICFLKTLNPKWDITGVDFNLDAIKHILKKYKISSINMNFLKDFDIKSDAITLLHVIEHIPFYQLNVFLSNIFNSLKKDGLFVISTPNLNSPLGTLFDYHLMFPPVHQLIFSDNWLIEYIEKNWKFKLIEKKSASVILENFDNWFGYFVDNAPTDEYKTLAKSFFTLKKNKQKFTNFHSYINDNNFGSEVILVFKKL